MIELNLMPNAAHQSLAPVSRGEGLSELVVMMTVTVVSSRSSSSSNNITGSSSSSSSRSSNNNSKGTSRSNSSIGKIKCKASLRVQREGLVMKATTTRTKFPGSAKLF